MATKKTALSLEQQLSAAKGKLAGYQRASTIMVRKLKAEIAELRKAQDVAITEYAELQKARDALQAQLAATPTPRPKFKIGDKVVSMGWDRGVVMEVVEIDMRHHYNLRMPDNVTSLGHREDLITKVVKGLEPPDATQCQAQIADNFMTLGGDYKPHRCTNKPTWLATEKHPGSDGKTGAMTLCTSCKEIFIRRMPKDHAHLVPIPPPTNIPLPTQEG